MHKKKHTQKKLNVKHNKFVWEMRRNINLFISDLRFYTEMNKPCACALNTFDLLLFRYFFFFFPFFLHEHWSNASNFDWPFAAVSGDLFILTVRFFYSSSNSKYKKRKRKRKKRKTNECFIIYDIKWLTFIEQKCISSRSWPDTTTWFLKERKQKQNNNKK